MRKRERGREREREKHDVNNDSVVTIFRLLTPRNVICFILHSILSEEWSKGEKRERKKKPKMKKKVKKKKNECIEVADLSGGLSW